MTVASSNDLIEMTWTAKCRPGTVYIQRPPLPIILLGGFILVLCGCLAGFIIAARYDVSSFSVPIELTSAERELPWITQQTIPTRITLRIVSQEDFEKERPSKTTIAFASYTRHGCTITIPSGQKIIAYPREKQARWADSEDGDTLAHEILHCIRGAWHQ